MAANPRSPTLNRSAYGRLFTFFQPVFPPDASLIGMMRRSIAPIHDFHRTARHLPDNSPPPVITTIPTSRETQTMLRNHARKRSS
jgi:hypothetical protein